jgi:hypothetical protein
VAESLRYGWEDKVWIADGCERHKADAVCEVRQQAVRDREQEARFAHTAWTGEGEQAHVGSMQQSLELSEFVFAAKQRGQWLRQVTR